MYVFYFVRYKEPKTHFPLHPALSGVARGTLEATYGVVRQSQSYNDGAVFAPTLHWNLLF